MFTYTNKSLGNVKDLNNRLKQQATHTSSNVSKLRSLKANGILNTMNRQQIGTPDKHQSMLVGIRKRSRAPSPVKQQSPLQKRATKRMSSTKKDPRIRKAMTSTLNQSFFGMAKKPLTYTPQNELEETKDSVFRENSKIIKESITKRGKVIEEVTVPEYNINKKWYAYERKQGTDFKLPSMLNK
jgi:hypothetical protein